MPDTQMLHPVTRITCGVFAALAGPVAIMFARVPTLRLQDAALFFVLTSMTLLTSYIAIAGRLPISRLWAVVAAPTLLALSIIPVYGVVSFIQEILAGEVVLSVWWVAFLAFILGRMSAHSGSWRRGGAEAGAAGTPKRDAGVV